MAQNRALSAYLCLCVEAHVHIYRLVQCPMLGIFFLFFETYFIKLLGDTDLILMIIEFQSYKCSNTHHLKKSLKKGQVLLQEKSKRGGEEGFRCQIRS